MSEGPTPTGWRRNAAGFDEPPSTSPSLKTVLMIFGGIVAIIVGPWIIGMAVLTVAFWR
jgi:hypothetical protein